jgi:hypothetical protein
VTSAVMNFKTELMPKKVFISCSHADKQFAVGLARELTQAGLTTVDFDALPAGESLQNLLLRELKSSDLVLFVVPALEGQGKMALMELGAAKALNKNIIGLLIDRARYGNSQVVRVLSELPLLDVGQLSKEAMVDKIISAASVH